MSKKKKKTRKQLMEDFKNTYQNPKSCFYDPCLSFSDIYPSASQIREENRRREYEDFMRSE